MFSAPQKLASSVSGFASRYSPAIITLLILSAGFYFYFNVIVSQNETELKERNFRGLRRMATNIEQKVEDYAENNANNFIGAIIQKKETSSKNIGSSRIIDSLKKEDSLKLVLLKADYGIDDTLGRSKNALGLRPDTSLNFSVKYSNGWQLRFRGKDENKDFVAYASFDKFTTSLLRRDLFPHYLLAVQDTVVYDEIDLSNQSDHNFLKDADAKDTSKKIQSGKIIDVNVGGEAYKLFLLSFTVEEKYKFTIGGYMPLESYISEQRYIPTYAVLLMVIGIIIVMLTFPLLKVFLMHRSEQMLVSNTFFSLASLHVIGALVVLVAMSSYVYFNLVLSAANNNLKTLAEKTKSNFTSEVDAALEELDSMKTGVHQKNSVGDRKKIQPSNHRQHTLIAADSTPAPYSAGSIYPYFKHIGWIDSNGMQLFRWTTNKYLPQKINVSGRDYFKAVKTGNLWLRKNKPYYFTCVSSWISNEKVAVISMHVNDSTPINDTLNKNDPIRKLLVVSLAAPFRSMFTAVVPESYGFCLVRDDGEVIFHLDEKRSLNENLIEECSHDENLQSLLRTRLPGFTSSRYSGSSQQFYVTPIAGMPYSIVTYRDLRTIWAEDLDVISACSILCLMNLAIILLAIIIIQASGYRRSLLQSQSILFRWLRPNKALKNIYRCVSIFYGCSMILQALFFIFYDQRDRLCLVGIAFSYSYILVSYAYIQFTVLHEADKGKKLQNRKPLYPLAAVYVFTSVLFMINLHSGHWMYLFSQLILLTIGWLFARSDFSINAMMNQKNFRWWYVSSLFTFMAATAITPLINFYLLSFKEERQLSLKRNQLGFTRQLMQQPADTLATFPGSIHLSYKAPFYFESFADSIVWQKEPFPVADTQVNGFENLYRKIKPSFSIHSREMEALIKTNDAANNEFYWTSRPDSGQIQLVYKIAKTNTYLDSPGISVYSTLKSEVENTGRAIKDNWLSFLLFIGSLLVSLWGFHFLLNRLIHRIFFKGYDNSFYLTESDLSFIPSLPHNENIFVNGSINSGKSTMLKSYFDNNKITVYEIDMVILSSNTPESIIELVEKIENADKVILIRHFELFMKDLAMTDKKLRLFEALLYMRKQIFVLSSRSFDSMTIKNYKIGVEAIDYTDRWSNVMNQFYNLYHKWKSPVAKDDLRSDTENAMLEASIESFNAGSTKINRIVKSTKHTRSGKGIIGKDFFRRIMNEMNPATAESYLAEQIALFLDRLDEECGHSDFLWSLRPTLLLYIKEHNKEFLKFNFQDKNADHMYKNMARHFTLFYEQICLKIQSLAANYYSSLWQSLNIDEQRTLYDIAEDDMVNPGNRDIAARLTDLGLVKRMEDIACYEVMNASFRNFIFTQLDKKEVKSLHADADGKGSWNSFQLPVLIVVIGIGLFLFTTQKDAFTSLITYLGAAAGGIAALLKVLGMMPSNKN